MKSFFFISFSLVILLDIFFNKYYSILPNYANKFNSIKHQSFFTNLFLIIVVAFIIITVLNYFNIIDTSIYNTYTFKYEVVSHIVEKSGETSSALVNPSVTTNVNGGTINLNNPSFSAKIPASAVNNLAAAASAAGGGALAFKVAKYASYRRGSRATKAGAAIATMVAVQATSALMGKVFNSGNSNETNNFIGNILHDPNTTNLSNQFTDFPLNLLPEMNQLVNVQIFFIFFLSNLLLSNYILKLDYNSILPKNRVGNVIKLLINKYISIWSKSSRFLIILSCIVLIITVIVLKIGFIYISSGIN